MKSLKLLKALLVSLSFVLLLTGCSIGQSNENQFSSMQEVYNVYSQRIEDKSDETYPKYLKELKECSNINEINEIKSIYTEEIKDFYREGTSIMMKIHGNGKENNYMKWSGKLMDCHSRAMNKFNYASFERSTEVQRENHGF